MTGATPATTAANKSRPADYTSEIENLCQDPMSPPASSPRLLMDVIIAGRIDQLSLNPDSDVTKFAANFDQSGALFAS